MADAPRINGSGGWAIPLASLVVTVLALMFAMYESSNSTSASSATAFQNLQSRVAVLENEIARSNQDAGQDRSEYRQGFNDISKRFESVQTAIADLYTKLASKADRK
jgi:hypothetical protein